MLLMGFNGAKGLKHLPGMGLLEFESHLAMGGQSAGELAQGTVVKEGALMDQQDALTEGRDVPHVMARQQDRCPCAPVVGGEEIANPSLGGDIEAQGGFIQKQHARLVQQGGQ